MQWAIVLLTLLYGAETWTVYQVDAQEEVPVV